MNTNEFKEKLDKSMHLKIIVAGLTGLVEDEGYTPHEAFQLLDATKRNTFHALAEIGRENKCLTE